MVAINEKCRHLPGIITGSMLLLVYTRLYSVSTYAPLAKEVLDEAEEQPLRPNGHILTRSRVRRRTS
jgi:hypothetical protein